MSTLSLLGTKLEKGGDKMKGLRTSEGADWKTAEMGRLAEERKIAFEERGIPDTKFWKIEPGEHMVTLLADTPRELDGKFGMQRVWQVEINNEQWSWAVRINTALYRKIVELYHGKKAVNIKVVRIGTGKQDTRYDVMKAE
ncbi:unnamed protein product [marine sediment metagenome]|uniref:Uncharacterized protein n=1 Tax=marine sediment metagenome TaxID=412755 RepID=X1BHA2_9ZZZZ